MAVSEEDVFDHTKVEWDSPGKPLAGGELWAKQEIEEATSDILWSWSWSDFYTSSKFC